MVNCVCIENAHVFPTYEKQLPFLAGIYTYIK